MKSVEERVVVNLLFYREFMVGANEQINFTNLLLERIWLIPYRRLES